MQRFILRKNGDSREKILANIAKFLEILPADREFVVEIRRYRRSRTLAQNAMLWGLAYPPIMEALGLSGESDKEMLHQAFCELYFGKVDLEIMGIAMTLPKRTTTTDEKGRRSVLTTLEFSDFWSFVQRQAAELGIYVPDPE